MQNNKITSKTLGSKFYSELSRLNFLPFVSSTLELSLYDFINDTKKHVNLGALCLCWVGD